MPATIIDVHAHLIPPQWEDFAARYGGGQWPRLEPIDACSANLMTGGKLFRRMSDQSWSLERRIEDMDRAGIAHQVVSPPPVMFCYWSEPAAGARFARMLNEHAAAFCARAPARFSGMATVPLQSPHHAITELRHAREVLGLRAVEIGTCVGGRNLDHPDLFEFFAACSELDVAVFVHAGAPVIGGDRLEPYYFKNLLGNPFESALAAASMVFGGVTSKLPGLRLCFAHGGGALSSVLGRLSHGWQMRPEAKTHLGEPPAALFRKLYYDTLTHDARQLRCLAEQVGVQALVVGTDYPFGMGVAEPAQFLAQTEFTQAEMAAISRRNALRFLGQPGMS